MKAMTLKFFTKKNFACLFIFAYRFMNLLPNIFCKKVNFPIELLKLIVIRIRNFLIIESGGLIIIQTANRISLWSKSVFTVIIKTVSSLYEIII